MSEPYPEWDTSWREQCAEATVDLIETLSKYPEPVQYAVLSNRVDTMVQRMARERYAICWTNPEDLL